MEKGLKVAEQVSSEILRIKMQQENFKSGSTFRIATPGRPLSVKVGRPELKTDRVEVKKLSMETIKELCLNLDLSKRGCESLISTINRDTKKKIVESNVMKTLNQAEQKIGELYTINNMYLDVRKGEDKQMRSVVVVKDTSGYVLDLIQERQLDPTTAMVRISIDGGQGFLKICTNIFDPKELQSHDQKYLDSGVQRIQILAMVEDSAETYDNMKAILDILQLNDLSYHLGTFYYFS